MSGAKLKTKYIVVGSIVIGIERWRLLFAGLVLPFLVILLLDGILTYQTDNSFWTWLVTILYFVAYTIIAVITHQVYLCGLVEKRWYSFYWSRRETRFLLYTIGLTSGVYLTSYIPILGIYALGDAVLRPFFVYIPIGVGFLGLVVFCYLVARFSLVFPAAAIDQKLTLKDSWRLTKNHQVYIILVSIIVPILFVLPGWVLQQSPNTFWISTIIDMALGVFIIGCLSLAYLEITRVETFS